MELLKEIKDKELPANESILKIREASRAVLAWQEDIANNGTINFDEKAEENIYNELHEATAVLFNVNPADIAVGSSTTELMSSLAWAIYPENGKNIVGTSASFPSTIYPWQRLSRKTGCEIRMVEQGLNGYVDPDHILDQIDEKTAVVCLSMVEYRSGQLYNLTDDPSETTNLFMQHPEIVRQMTEELERIKAAG